MRRRVDLEVKGQPKPKARPRVTRHGVYSTSDADEEALRWELKIACEHKPFEGPVAVGMIFYRQGNVGVDIDNLVKLVLDAGNTVAWRDDKQVVAITARKRPATKPRTLIAIKEETE